MNRWVRALVITSAAVLVLLAVGQPVAGQSEEYDISVDGSIDTPDREVTLEGDSYQVSAVKQADPGDTVTVNVEAPSDRLVEVLLYNSERQIVEQKTLSNPGSGSVSFDLSSMSTGSYMFAVQYSGVTEAVHPLVIRAYEVSVTAPSEATTDESIDLSATLTELRSASTSGVEFVIVNERDTLRVDASETSDGSYEATADLSSLSTGDYSVYATVRGTEEINGNKIRLGLSQPESLTVSSPSTDSSSGDSNSGSSGGGSSSDGGAVVDSGTETVASQETATPIQIGSTTTQPPTAATETTPSDADPMTTASTTTASGTTAEAEPTTTAQPTTTESGAITPRSPTETQDTTTSTTGPGFGAGLSVLALGSLVAVSVLRRRRDA